MTTKICRTIFNVRPVGLSSFRSNFILLPSYFGQLKFHDFLFTQHEPIGNYTYLQEIRRNVCWKLAEVLLHGVSDLSYERPDISQSGGGGGDASRALRGGSLTAGVRAASASALNSAVAADSPWKPRKHAGSNLFVPRTRLEETVLLLLLSENMAR